MSEIQNDEIGKKTKKKSYSKKHSTHIDMTPMVDLACLLITFFMLTTAFAKPKVIEIAFPNIEDNTYGRHSDVDKKRVLNILVSEDDKVYYYLGKIDIQKNEIPTLVKTNYSSAGLRKALIDKNSELFQAIEQLREDVVLNKKLKDITDINQKQDSLKLLEKILKRSNPYSPIVFIKIDDKAKYRNFVDVLDEMAICNIAAYFIVPIKKEEQNLIRNYR